MFAISAKSFLQKKNAKSRNMPLNNIEVFLKNKKAKNNNMDVKNIEISVFRGLNETIKISQKYLKKIFLGKNFLIFCLDWKLCQVALWKSFLKNVFFYYYYLILLCQVATLSSICLLDVSTKICFNSNTWVNLVPFGPGGPLPSLSFWNLWDSGI